MQQRVSNGNDNSKSSNSNGSMPPQVHQPNQVHQMQSIQQPQYAPLAQLNGLQEWPHQQQPTDQPQGQLQLSSSSTPSTPIIKPLSPTSLSVISASTGGYSRTSIKTKSSSRQPQHQVKRGSGVDIKGPTPEVAQQLRFPWKLHLLLERCEYEHQQKLAAYMAEGQSTSTVPDMPISWLPCGKAFKVHDKERFVREVMPSFFGTQSFKTFQRNLNLWGFTRVSKGPQKDVCSHPLFLKGFPAVCQSMKRIVLKGTGRGNRAPLGGVDVSSVQAVVAAAAMQQAQQQHAQQQASGLNQGGNNQMQHNIQAQQVIQQHQQMQVQQNNTDQSVMPQQSTLTHIHQNQQQNHQQQMPQNQQQQFLIENGTILPAPIPSQQKLVVLPSQPNPNASATTTVLWPNILNQPLQQQQQQLNAADANANLQKSLQQLSAIIQQLNGCNASASASVNANTVNNNGINNTVNTSNFQPQQQLQVAPTPLPAMVQQQPAAMPQHQASNPNTVVAPAPMATQDLVALLLQRNLQQQVSQVQGTQSQQTQSQVQLQLPNSLFQNGNFASPQPAPALSQQQPALGNGALNNPFATATSPTNFAQPQQQHHQGALMGNNTNIFQPQQQVQQVATPTPAPTQPANSQQQNQLLQLLLQQSGWSTSSSA